MAASEAFIPQATEKDQKTKKALKVFFLYNSASTSHN